MLDETVFRGRRLAIVGSICRDVKMGPLHPGQHLLEDGETPTAFISETIGGGGANSALAAAALASDVRFAGKVGADPLGQRLEQSLRGCGLLLPRRVDRLAVGSRAAIQEHRGYRRSPERVHDALARAG